MALYELKAMGKIKRIAIFCQDHNINAPNLYRLKREPYRDAFQLEWLDILVQDYGISPEWLITGSGSMFKKNKPQT